MHFKVYFVFYSLNSHQNVSVAIAAIFRVILIIKPTRCTNSSNLFLEQNSTCFGQVFCPSSGVQYCIHSNRYMSLPCVQYKTQDDRHRTCPKHVEFYSKNKFEKLVHLVGFIIRLYHDARSSEYQIHAYVIIKRTHRYN